MLTPYGEIPDDDIQALEFKLRWYLRYGNLPTLSKRETEQARMDYGFQYERYVGHLFEANGYRVEYTGIRKGVEDGGIDLVARAPRKIRLIQCKRWRIPVGIDVISRLHGAVDRFIWEERQGKPARCRTNICGVLFSSGPLTDDAKALATHLGILSQENHPYRPYPAIKGKRITPNAGKILMPFDASYDKTTMDLSRGDCFFSSPKDAFLRCFFYPPYHADILKKIRTEL